MAHEENPYLGLLDPGGYFDDSTPVGGIRPGPPGPSLSETMCGIHARNAERSSRVLAECDLVRTRRGWRLGMVVAVGTVTIWPYAEGCTVLFEDGSEEWVSREGLVPEGV